MCQPRESRPRTTAGKEEYYNNNYNNNNSAGLGIAFILSVILSDTLTSQLLSTGDSSTNDTHPPWQTQIFPNRGRPG